MKRAKRTRVTHRQPKVDPKLKAHAESMLAQAQAMFDAANGLDTEVRDTVAEGLAFIVHSAYDTLSIAECVSASDDVAFIQARTYEWFRERGFVEWFCAGASTLFKTTPRSFFRIKTAKARSGKAVVFSREKVG